MIIKTSVQSEDADIRAAINAVAAHQASKLKRDLVNRMTQDIEGEVLEARLAGRSIDTTSLFVRLVEKYAS